jgi:hypothetical protein
VTGCDCDKEEWTLANLDMGSVDFCAGSGAGGGRDDPRDHPAFWRGDVAAMTSSDWDMAVRRQEAAETAGLVEGLNFSVTSAGALVAIER